MRKMLVAAVVAATLAPTLALADPPPWAPAHGRRGHEYDNHGRYYQPRPIRSDERVWRGHDGRYYCRRGNGTTGLVIGGAVGALVGHELDGGRDHTLGTVLGAAGGALLGRSIDRSHLKCS